MARALVSQCTLQSRNEKRPDMGEKKASSGRWAEVRLCENGGGSPFFLSKILLRHASVRQAPAVLGVLLASSGEDPCQFRVSSLYT